VGPTAAIGLGLRGLLARRIRSLADEESWGRRARAVQDGQLGWILRTAARTEFGRAHGFERLGSWRGADLLRAYQAEVPIHTYADLKPSLERMRTEGARDVLWPGVVRDWAQTSGTTAGDKYVPVSRALLRHNSRAALDMYAHAARFGVSLPGVFAGKILFLGGSSDLAVNEHGVRTGDLSGIVTRLIRWPLTAVWLPGADIALESDWPTKIERMCQRCLDEDVRVISGMPSWALVLFERVLQRARAGGRRAGCIRDVWPNLRLFVHGGVKYDPFERRVRQMWSGDPDGDDIPTRLEVYAASEAFIAIQDRRGDPGMRLNLDGRVFYEFVPAEDAGNPAARALVCDEVEPGRRYVVVLTTCAGLWRCDLGDVVEFDTVPPEGPPRLRIVGRSKHFMNAFGENVIAEHVELAVADAARLTGASIGEFTAAPVFPEGGRPAQMELVIEWAGPDDPAARARFADEFDRGVQARSNDYAAKRAGDLGMGPVRLTTVPMGVFHQWLASEGKLGGQHKCPRCAMDRRYADAVLAVAPTIIAD